MSVVMLARLLVYSLAHVWLFWSIVYDVPWVRYPLVAILVMAVFLRMSKANVKLIQELMACQKAFVEDWIPPLIVIPFCTAAALQRGMQVEALITFVYWFSTMRFIRVMSDWKKLHP